MSVGNAAQRLVGCWRLADSYDIGLVDGKVVRSRGRTPVGMLFYGSDRRMAVQVMNDGRPPFTSSHAAEESPAQIKAALLGYTAYFGTFEVNEQEAYVIHRMEGSLLPHEVGAARQRFYLFSASGNRVTLTTPPFEADGDRRVRRIVWERVNAGQ